MKIDLCEKFKSQIVEGVEKHDLLDAMSSNSETFQMQDDQSILHVPSGKRIVFDCAYTYFEPVKPYYKPTKTSSCNYVQRAMNADAADHECVACIRSCLKSGLKIKPKKFAISRDYYKK